MSKMASTLRVAISCWPQARIASPTPTPTPTPTLVAPVKIARMSDASVDFLADAMHWCDYTGDDFFLALAQACRHYIHELNDQQQDERRMIP